MFNSYESPLKPARRQSFPAHPWCSRHITGGSNACRMVNKMGIDEYKSALKKAEKELKTCMDKGEDPYLPVLEDYIQQSDIVSQINLGYTTMLTENIVGTTNAARSNAFTKSFLPLLPADSEFANKWGHLYDNLVLEGMREGITAFEYLGKFYVREGNKRVSVSRQLKTAYVEGTVTRIVPKKTDDPEIIVYYEYIDFYKKSQNNEIYFSKPGSFAKFAEMVAPGKEEWSKEDRDDLRTFYTRFRLEYQAKKGEETLSLSPSDAMLKYVSLMGYSDVKDKTPMQIRNDLPKVWEEFRLGDTEESLTISSAPTTQKAFKLSKLFSGSKPLKIAFVYHTSPEKSSWCTQHEKGREYVENVFGTNVTTKALYFVTQDHAEISIGELCHDKYDIIFDTTPLHNAACAKLAVLNPNVKILNCSLKASTKSMRTYYLRAYESKFLLGIIAGSATKTGNIYYVSDYAVYGSVASINAFALGVQSVNSGAVVHLSWTSAKDFNPEKEIKEKNCDIISNLDWSSPRNFTPEYGLYHYKETGEHVQLAYPIWDWGKMYAGIISGIQQGSWDYEENAIGNQSLGYWWGLASGAMNLAFTGNISSPTLNLVDFLKKQISSENYNPFTSRVRYQNGKSFELAELSALDMLNMNELLEGINGSIPTLADVKDENSELTRLQGVKQ